MRQEALKTLEEAIDPFMVHPLETPDAAAAALDALLDYLEANADETAQADYGRDRLGSITVDDLLSVLREVPR